MPFATLQGIRIPLLAASGADQIRTSTGVTFSSGLGQMDSGRRQKRRVWRGTACFYAEGDSYADGAAFRDLLAGRGHLVRFSEGFEASTWLGPEPGYRDCYVDPTAADPFGGETGILQVRASGVTDRPFLAYDFQLPSTGWAFVWWEYDDDGFYHRAISWDGTTRRGWQDGVRDDDVGTASGPGTSNFLRPIVTDGIARLVRAGSDAFQVGPVLGLQFCPSAAQMAQLTQHIQPFGPMPALRLEGEMIGEEWVHVRPTPLRSDFFLLYDSSGRRNNVRLIEFDLAEVVVQDVRGSRVFGIASTQPDQGPYKQEDEPEPDSFGDAIYIADLSSGQAWNYGGVEVISAAVTTIPRVGVIVADEETGAFKYALVANLVSDLLTTQEAMVPSMALIDGRLWLCLATKRVRKTAPQTEIQVTGPNNSMTSAAGLTTWIGGQSLAFEIDSEDGTILGVEALSMGTTHFSGQFAQGGAPNRHWLETDGSSAAWTNTQYSNAGPSWSSLASSYLENTINTDGFGRAGWRASSGVIGPDAALVSGPAPRVQSFYGDTSMAYGSLSLGSAMTVLQTMSASPSPRMIGGSRYAAVYLRGRISGSETLNVNRNTGGTPDTKVGNSMRCAAIWLLRIGSDNEIDWVAAFGGVVSTALVAITESGPGYFPLADGGVVLYGYGYGAGVALPTSQTLRLIPGSGAEVTTVRTNPSRVVLWCLNADGTHRWSKYPDTSSATNGLNAFAVESSEHGDFLYGLEGYRSINEATTRTVTIGVGETNQKSADAIGETAAISFSRIRRFLTKRSLLNGDLDVLPPVISSPLATQCLAGSTVVRNGEICITITSDADILIDIGAITIPAGHYRLRFDIDTLAYLGNVPLPSTSPFTGWGGPLLTLPSGS
jgi:hypothetical protein